MKTHSSTKLEGSELHVCSELGQGLLAEQRPEQASLGPVPRSQGDAGEQKLQNNPFPSLPASSWPAREECSSKRVSLARGIPKKARADSKPEYFLNQNHSSRVRQVQKSPA